MGVWLARLKNENMGGTHATKTTKTPQGDENGVFVGFVAYPGAPFKKNKGPTEAANDPAPTPTTAMVDIGTVRPPGLSPLLCAASLALDASIVAAGVLPRKDPDAHCWPHSTAMNSAEIDLFTARLHRFTDKGLTLDHAQALADKLVMRDRDDDNRRLCLECVRLQGVGRWSCGNWKQAAIGTRAADAGLAHELVVMLQHCPGFREATWVR